MQIYLLSLTPKVDVGLNPVTVCEVSFMTLRSVSERKIIGPMLFEETNSKPYANLTLRLLMSYIYIYRAPILDVSRSHTTTHHSR